MTNVDTPSQAWEAMKPLWDKSRTLDGGTAAMKVAGKKYLPAFEAETTNSYQNRLQSNHLYNAYRFALNNLTGKVFSRPVIVDANMGQPFKRWTNDIDLMGNNITQFTKRYFREVLSGALSHIFVDFPDFVATNLAQERALNLRPFFRLIRAEDLIAARSIMRNGKEVVTHARIFERSTEVDPQEEFAEVEVERIRVYDEMPADEDGPPRVMWRLFEQGPRGEWNEVRRGVMTIDEIPLVTAYAERTAFMQSNMPLQDLIDTNIRHWQSNSDQIRILSFSRFPMMAATGVTSDEGGNLAAGPGAFYSSMNHMAKFEIIETSGSSVELGFKDLERLEGYMQRLAMDPLIRRAGNVSATERALDSREANSQLQSIAIGVQDSMNRAFELMGKWINQDAGTVTINTEFGVTDRSVDVDAILKMHFAEALSTDTLWDEMKRRGVLDDLFDPQSEKLKLRNEPSRRDQLSEDDGMDGGLDGGDTMLV